MSDPLREALKTIRDRLASHWAYAELTEAREEDVGGDTAEFSYLVRMADAALAQPTAPADAELLDTACATLTVVFARTPGALHAFANGISKQLVGMGWTPPTAPVPADARDAALLSAWDRVRDPGPAGDDVPHPVFCAGFHA